MVDSKRYYSRFFSSLITKGNLMLNYFPIYWNKLDTLNPLIKRPRYMFKQSEQNKETTN